MVCVQINKGSEDYCVLLLFLGNLEKLRRFYYCLKVGGVGLMRIVRGMQRSLLCEDLNNSFIRGIGITAPKARTRGKLICL